MNLPSLLRLPLSWLKSNPAGEGNFHPGPYNILGRGWLPDSWGRNLNFWQMDLDPLGTPSSSIVEACVWAYIRAIAQLPGYHKRQEDDGEIEIINTSALSRLLRAPNGYETMSDVLVHLIRSLLLTGNSYWIAKRNDRNEVVELHWTDPRQCRPRVVGIDGQAFSEIFYEIGANPLLDMEAGIPFRSSSFVVPARDILHVKLATPRHPLIGETWLQALSYELATRGAISSASATFAGNMSRPSGVLTTDMVLTAAQTTELRAKWNEAASGLNAGGVPILSSGLKWQPISVSNQDAQIIDQLKLTDRTVAAVFGVPGILLGAEGQTQTGAEAIMAQWLASGLGWLINHIEAAFDAFIGLNEVPSGREWTEFDTRALLRSLYKERIDGLVRGVQGGIYSPNEARALEGYGAVDAGDEPRVQQQVVPLSAWDKMPVMPAPPAPAPPPAAGNDNPPPDAQGDQSQQNSYALFMLERAMMNGSD